MALDINQFRTRLNETKVECEVCHYRGHSLIAHLQTKHTMSAGQYRKLYSDKPLASKVLSELLRRVGRDQLLTDDLAQIVEGFEFKTERLGAEFEKIGAKWKATSQQMELIGPVDEYFEFDANVRLIAYAMTHCLNLFSEGPTGCGKTEGFIQAHVRAKRPYKQVNMHGDVTVSNFIGMEKATPQKGTYFDYGDLPRAMGYPNGQAGPILPGYTLIVDEVDYTPPPIAASLNPVLSRLRTLHVPETGETLIAQPGFNVMATANTGGKGDNQGQYTGTEVLNTAFLDRFPIKLRADYLGWEEGQPKRPIIEEGMLRHRFPGAEQSEITQMVKMANEVRIAFKMGQLAVTMSTRKLVDYFKMRLELNDKKMALSATLTNWLSDDDRVLVEQVLTRCGIN